MDKRLLTIANLIRKNKVVCDIGTDHAYLPCYLINKGICPFVYACDINEKPLLSAKTNVTANGLNDKIRLVLSNGLEKLNPDDIDDIVIAGMGGELIFEILTGVSWTTQSQSKRDKMYILQPMTNVEFLRKNLYTQGFEILSETPVIDNKHFYTIMQVMYTGNSTIVDNLFLYFGKVPFSADCKDKNEYITRVHKKLLKIQSGLILSTDDSDYLITYKQNISNVIERATKEYGCYLSITN